MNKYIIVNADKLQEKIKELKEQLKASETLNDNIRASIETFEIKSFESVLLNSIPLIPEIEKAYDAGILHNELSLSFDYPKNRYMSYLKLDI